LFAWAEPLWAALVACLYVSCWNPRKGCWEAIPKSAGHYPEGASVEQQVIGCPAHDEVACHVRVGLVEPRVIRQVKVLVVIVHPLFGVLMNLKAANH
jgi:hypothetical protein